MNTPIGNNFSHPEYGETCGPPQSTMVQIANKKAKIEVAMAKFRFKWWQIARAFKLAGHDQEWQMKKSTSETSKDVLELELLGTFPSNPRSKCSKLDVTCQA